MDCSLNSLETLDREEPFTCLDWTLNQDYPAKITLLSPILWMSIRIATVPEELKQLPGHHVCKD